jgi:hypothetical protein
MGYKPNPAAGYFINNKIVGCSVLSIEKAAKISHTATLWGMYVKEIFVEAARV